MWGGRCQMLRMLTIQGHMAMTYICVVHPLFMCLAMRYLTDWIAVLLAPGNFQAIASGSIWPFSNMFMP